MAYTFHGQYISAQLSFRTVFVLFFAVMISFMVIYKKCYKDQRNSQPNKSSIPQNERHPFATGNTDLSSTDTRTVMISPRSGYDSSSSTSILFDKFDNFDTIPSSRSDSATTSHSSQRTSLHFLRSQNNTANRSPHSQVSKSPYNDHHAMHVIIANTPKVPNETSPLLP